MGIVASAITLLSTSAAVAWLIHGAVAPATAQSGNEWRDVEALMSEPWARRPDNPRAAGELPAIARIAFEFRAGRSTEVDGKATAGAQVVLLRGGERIGRRWHERMVRRLTVGAGSASVTIACGRRDARAVATSGRRRRAVSVPST
jgi:hypothetical protein